VRLKARAVGRSFRRHTRTLDFEVEAEQPGHQPAAAALALVQPPTVSGSALLKTLAVLAVVGGAIWAWFGLIRPEIRDAAADQVDTRIVELTPTDDGAVAAPTTAPTDVVDDAEPEPGVPSFFRLEVTPGLTETADDVATVPDGQRFDLTDVRVENPFNDRGVATLLVNGEQVFVWSLQNIRGQLFEPRITQLQLAGGDVLTFSVKCDEIGDASRSTCTTALNLGGLQYPQEG
jgi:hypothetical protein